MLPQLLTWVLDGAAMIAVPVGVLALTVSTIAVLAGWTRRREILQRQDRPFVPDRLDLRQDTLTAGLLDVASATNAVFRQFESLAANRFVALEVAVQPNLAVRADPRAFQEILADLLQQAIEQSPCGRVLLGAGHVGGRVQITVSDEGAHADRGLRASRLRPAQRLAALQGATMDIDARKGQGTTVVLRLPTDTPTRRSSGQEAMPDPARVWASADRVHEGSGAGR